MTFSVVELIGYLASALVVISLAMTSVVRLRVISLAGSVAFVAYGLLLGAVPIVITNVAVAILNVWFLRKEFAPDRDLNAVLIAHDDPYLADFLRSHASDIAKLQPAFDGARDGDLALLLTRDGLPAGAYVGALDQTTLNLRLDYVMSAYRDSRLGQWLYSGPGAKVLRAAGVERVATHADTPGHRDYLLSIGFHPTPDGLARDLG